MKNGKKNIAVRIIIWITTGIMGVAACIASLIFVLVLLIYLAMPINVKNIVGSPDGKYQAVVFERNPGATSGFVYCVSVMKSGGTVSIFDMGNVYCEETYDSFNEIVIGWIDDDQLLIVQGSGDVYLKEEEVHGIEITYDKPTHR